MPPTPEYQPPTLRRSLSSCSSRSEDLSPKYRLCRRVTGDSVTGGLQINFSKVTPQAYRFSPSASVRLEAPPLLSLTRFETEFKNFQVIGRGSFSEVFRATHKLDGIEYALKRSENSASARREISILAKLANASFKAFGGFVVKYFSGWVEESVCIVQLELCGESVAQRWRRSRPFSEHACRRIAGDVCKALKFIHGLEIVHLDVKPDNIVVASEDVYKLADFGLAREARSIEGDDFSSGDARYLPREVLRNEKGHLKKVDVFAMGATLLEISGAHELPSNGPQWHEIRDGRFNKVGVSLRFFKFLETLLAADPQKRPDAERILRQIHF